MKTILKFSKLLLFTFLIVNISSCENEDYLIFTAINQKEVKFQNEIQDVYKISSQTSNNIAERLVWNEPDFDAPYHGYLCCRHVRLTATFLLLT
jgi:hypothetical protein